MAFFSSSYKSIRAYFQNDFPKALIDIFFFAGCLEGAAVFFYLITLPGDPKNGLFLGLSMERLGMLFFVLFYSLACGFGLALNRKNPEMRRKIFPENMPRRFLLKGSVLALILLSALVFFLLTSPAFVTFHAGYAIFFEKLDPLLILAGLFIFQVLSLVCGVSLGKIDRKSEAINEICVKYLAPLAIFIFPFLFFFPRTIPVNGEFNIVANDFIPTSYTYKVYLLDLLSHGHFPLWSPAEGAGYPFFSSPFPQPFYPLNLPLAFLYGINGGHSILDHQRYAVLGISIFAIGIFYWLKEFKLSHGALITAALLTPVSYKIAELIRYPAGLHSAAWYPWILLSITRILKSETKRRSILPALGLAAAIYCLITAGYPYYIYYVIFLALPYLLIFLIPAARRAFFPEMGTIPFSRYLIAGAGGLIGLALSSPYLLNMGALLSATTGRGGNNFEYATSHVFNFVDTVGSLIFPPASQAEGWYYFGLACLFLILIFLIFSRYLTAKLPFVAWYQNKWVKGFLLIWFAIISYITYGRESVLFSLLWKYLPFFSHLRTWGRLNLVLVPLLALLTAMAVDFALALFKEWSSRGDAEKGESLQKWLIALACVYLPILLVQTYFLGNGIVDNYWSKYFTNFSGREGAFVTSGVTAFLFLLAAGYLFSRVRTHRSFYSFFFVAAFGIITVIDLWPVSSLMWWSGTMRAEEDTRRDFNFLENVLPESFLHPRDDELRANAMVLRSTYSAAYSEDWYFDSYKKFFLAHDFEKEPRDILLGVADPARIFFSRSIEHATIKDYLADSSNQAFQYEILHFDGDRLELKIDAPAEGYVSYIDNWDPAWQAEIDGRQVPVEKLFGVFKSARVPAGSSKLIFQYQPSWIPSFSW